MSKTPEEVFEMNRVELEKYVQNSGVINLEIFAIITLGMIFNSEGGPRDFQPRDLRNLADKIPEIKELLEEINKVKIINSRPKV